MKRNVRRLCLFLALVTILLTCAGCAPNYQRWMYGTWEFEREYKYAGRMTCTVVFHEDKTITYNGISTQGGNFYVREDNSLRLIIGSGSFEVFDYTYDAQLGREENSGCWCMINSDRMFLEGTMYKKISNEH